MSADEHDLDAEILGMVGDDSSDSEGSEAGEEPTSTQPISHRTPSEEPKPSVEKVDDPPSTRRGLAQKVKRKGGRRKVNKRELEDELDDLADSPSPAASPASDAMLESDSSSPAPAVASPIDDGPAYPLEGIYLDSADRARIQALPEIQREEILAERAAENTKREQDLKLRDALAATQAAASKHQKRKAAAAELDDDAGQRKSSRAKVEKRNVLDDYKKAREARGADRTSRLDPRRDRDRKRRSHSASSASDRDADGESEVEWAPEVSHRDEPAADLKDFERCRIGRSSFAKVCFYPNFETTMKGCFARVSVGVNNKTGENEYRMTQIKGFKQGRPYSLEVSSTGKKFTIDQYAIVAQGNAEKPYPFAACSDSKITQSELDRYVDTLSKEHIRVPKKAWLVQKLDDIHKFLNVEWTEEVLAGKFARQRAMEKRVDPANAAKVKREGIMKRKAEAEQAQDWEEANRCDAELAALDNNATSNGATIASRPSPLKNKPIVGESQQDRLARLNLKNRGKNANDVRQALIEERRKRERAIAEAKARAVVQAAEAARLAAEAPAKDSHLAVPGASKAMMRELFGDSPGTSRAGTPFSGIGTPGMRRSRAGTPVNGVGVAKKSGLGLGAMNKDDEDMGVDLGIDVEI